MTAWTVEALAAKGYNPDGSRVPARQLSTSPAGDRAGQHAQAAPRGVKAVADAGHMVDGDVCAPRRLSSRAIARLQPEQRLQIEVVTHWRPRLVPGARLLGINGELPGGGKTMALRAAIRREMGYTRGCADMLAIRQGHILWLEAKVGTDQTDEQAPPPPHPERVVTRREDRPRPLPRHGLAGPAENTTRLSLYRNPQQGAGQELSLRAVRRGTRTDAESVTRHHSRIPACPRRADAEPQPVCEIRGWRLPWVVQADRSGHSVLLERPA